MIPIARTENLLIQEVGNELIVYDQENNASHCLNPMASRVWYYCDGNNTINDIAKQLEKELEISTKSEIDMRGLVYLTLEELERYNLIKDYVKQPIGTSGISRRNVIKTATLVGGFAIGSMFPLVRSIVAPEPAMAQSGCRKEKTVSGTGIGGNAVQAIGAAAAAVNTACGDFCGDKCSYTLKATNNTVTGPDDNAIYTCVTTSTCTCT
jgi:hypothetical protein